MDKYSRALLVDAKEEYTRQLVTVLINPIYDGIKSIFKFCHIYFVDNFYVNINHSLNL